MLKNDRGFGMVELLVALAVLVLVAYGILQRQTSSRPRQDQALRNSLAAQQLSAPANVDLSQKKQVEGMVTGQLLEARDVSEKALGCSVDGGVDCSASPAPKMPSPPPSP